LLGPCTTLLTAFSTFQSHIVVIVSGVVRCTIDTAGKGGSSCGTIEIVDTIGCSCLSISENRNGTNYFLMMSDKTIQNTSCRCSTRFGL